LRGTKRGGTGDPVGASSTEKKELRKKGHVGKGGAVPGGGGGCLGGWGFQNPQNPGGISLLIRLRQQIPVHTALPVFHSQITRPVMAERALRNAERPERASRHRAVKLRKGGCHRGLQWSGWRFAILIERVYGKGCEKRKIMPRREIGTKMDSIESKGTARDSLENYLKEGSRGNTAKEDFFRRGGMRAASTKGRARGQRGLIPKRSGVFPTKRGVKKA